MYMENDSGVVITTETITAPLYLMKSDSENLK